MLAIKWLDLQIAFVASAPVPAYERRVPRLLVARKFWLEQIMATSLSFVRERLLRRLVFKCPHTLLFLSLVFILTVYKDHLWIRWNVGFHVSDRQCVLSKVFRYFLTAHRRNSLSRPRNCHMLQPASEKKRKETQDRTVTVQLFKAGILDLNGKLAGNTPTWGVQR